MKTGLFASLLVSVLLVMNGMKAQAETAPNWIYLDLGEVIVTGNPTDGYSFVPGALELIAELKAAGHKVALISNIPETWGATCALKFAGLKNFLDSRMIGPQTLDWTLLDKVILPPFDRYRKPQPFIFMTALANACPGKAMFLGESDDETSGARQLGFATYNTSSEIQLPSVDKVGELLDADFNFQHPTGCGFDDLLSQHLEPQDVGLVSGCVVSTAD